jgi:hypothetical protein
MKLDKSRENFPWVSYYQNVVLLMNAFNLTIVLCYLMCVRFACPTNIFYHHYFLTIRYFFKLFWIKWYIYMNIWWIIDLNICIAINMINCLQKDLSNNQQSLCTFTLFSIKIYTHSHFPISSVKVTTYSIFSGVCTA